MISKLSIILGIAACLSLCQAAEPPSFRTSLEPDSVQDALLKKALSNVYIDSFSAAVACTDSMIGLDTAYWPAHVIKAGIIYTEMADNEEYDREDYFKALIDTSLEGLDKHLSDYPRDKWGLFFKGTALGYLAVWEAEHGGWLNAVIKGLKAGKYFSKAVEEDSLFYDAYLGLGTLHYWRSAKLGIIRSLPFVADRREQGIQEVNLAVANSSYSSVAAAIGLAWIHIHRKEYSKTIGITANLLGDGFGGRQILWPRAIAEFNRGNAQNSIKHFSLIREGLLKKGNQNSYNLVVTGYCLGVAHYWRGDYESALKYLDEVLRYKLSPEIEKRAAKHLKKAKEYRAKVLEKRDTQKTTSHQ